MDKRRVDGGANIRTLHRHSHRSPAVAPLLHLARVPALVAVAAPLPTAIPVALASSRAWWKRGCVDRRILRWSAAAGFPMIVAGALVTP